MRVAGNKLKHIIDFFNTELGGTFPSGEIEAMLSFAVETVLGFSKTQLLQKIEENINQSDLLKLYDCAKGLKKNIPLQYLLGETIFYDLKFKVNEHVLIPRPETEELVDMVLKENKTASSLLDIGTGSGCIPITFKKNLPQSEVLACDISTEALSLAKRNAEINNSPVHFFEANVLEDGQVEKKAAKTFDIIISNPPYIKKSEKKQMHPNVLDHEPHLALFVSGPDAIIFYKKIVDLCANALAKKGKLYFELNPLTANEVDAYAKASGLFETTYLIKDMSGALRFLKAVKN